MTENDAQTPAATQQPAAPSPQAPVSAAPTPEAVTQPAPEAFTTEPVGKALTDGAPIAFETEHVIATGGIPTAETPAPPKPQEAPKPFGTEPSERGKKP